MCDDLAACGEPHALSKWLTKLIQIAPAYGYNIKKGKSFILSSDPAKIKPFEKLITNGILKYKKGAKYLGEPVGSEEYKNKFFFERMADQNKKLEKLTRLSKTSPRSSYHLYSTYVKHKINYLQRTGLKPIHYNETQRMMKHLVDSWMGMNITSEHTMEEISHPRKYGGLGISVTTMEEETREQRERCEQATKDLRNKLLNQDQSLPPTPNTSEYNKKLAKAKRGSWKTLEDRAPTTESTQRMKEIAIRGTSNWMAAQPIKVQGKYLTKAQFHDVIRLSHGIEPKGMPTTCACGQKNSVVHAKNCHTGGYINARHDRVRDYIHKKASSVYNDTEIEPKLQRVEEQILNPGANKSDEARSDIRIKGYERDYQNTMFDVKVINTSAETHLIHDPREAMKKVEEGKDRSYKDRISRVDNATFVPMIFTSKGARTGKTNGVQSTLARRIAQTKKDKQNEVARNIYIDLSFILLRSELACIRCHRRPRTTLTH